MLYWPRTKEKNSILDPPQGTESSPEVTFPSCDNLLCLIVHLLLFFLNNVTTEIHTETVPFWVQKPLRVPHLLFVEKALVS